MKPLLFWISRLTIVALFFLVAWPARAQNTPPGFYQIPACDEQGNSSAPEPYCPSGPVTDTVPFVAPCGDKSAADTTCSINASAFPSGASFVGALSNKTYGIIGADPNSVLGGARYVMQKTNDKHLLYRIDNSMIFLVEDTTFAGSEVCGNGRPAIQRFSPRTGINFVARSLACGGTTQVQSGARNVGFEYNPSLETNPMAPVNACTTPHTNGDLSGTSSQLIFHGQGICNGQAVEALVIKNVSGAGAGEVFVYCKDKGLCAWYQSVNFTNDQPKSWTSTKDLCNLKPAICPKPPSGPFLNSDTGDVPKWISTEEPVNGLGLDTNVSEQVSGFSAQDFANVTFPNFAREDNKFKEMLDPNTPGGGKLIQGSLQGQVVYPSEQSDYGKQGPLGYIGYKETFGAGCLQAYFEKTGEQPIPTPTYSHDAAQAVVPDQYPDVQASLHNFGAMRIPGPDQKSGLQWRVRNPDMVSAETGQLTNEYFLKLKKCNEKVSPKPVSAVQVPVTGAFQAIFQGISDFITSIFRLNKVSHTGNCDKNGKNCSTFFDYTAFLNITKVATIFLPGSIDMEKMAVDQKDKKQGVFLTFFPSDLINRLSYAHGFTNKENGNVAAESTDTEGNKPDDFPHSKMHEIKDTFNKISPCLLMPESVQKARNTPCKLGPEISTTPTPTPTPSLACNAKNPSNVNGGPKNTYISDGLIALAIKVSRYTCTPAEFLVGILAGETRGLNYNGTSDTYITGDPNERVCRTSACLNQTGDLGPFSWSQSLYQDQFNTWGPLARDCFSAIGAGSPPDSRLLGQDMCVTSSKFWGSMHDNGNPVGSCSGANEKSYNLEDIPTDKLKLAYFHFCGSAPVCDQLWQKDQELIDAYKAAVAKVKAEMASCLR